jgi:3-oxoacyl-[acyl-carrier-protein] synthase-3
MDAYINAIEVVLPNAPVGNNEIEGVLGKIQGQPSRSKAMILRNNGIKQRYYAIDPDTHAITHSNCTLTAEAIVKLCDGSGLSADAIECLACGTASPDQFMPNHAAMVHAEIGRQPCEVVATTGVCCSGLTALKYAYLSVAAAATQNAVCTASEIVSRSLRSAWLSQSAHGSEKLEADPIIGFDAEFLRWMLSDGAGAALIENKPSANGTSLRIDWIDILSRAYSAQACMYSGAEKRSDGTLEGWASSADPGNAFKAGYFRLKQDVKILSTYVVRLGVETLEVVKERRALDTSKINWFLPHLSSEYFRQPIARGISAIGCEIAPEKWFTNLATKGNTGSASMLIMLEELLKSGRLRSGDTILCLVPESSRFTYGWMHLTVV